MTDTIASRRPFASPLLLVGAGACWIPFIATVETYAISFMRGLVVSRAFSDMLLWYGDVAVKGIGWFAVLVGTLNHFCPDNGLNWKPPLRSIVLSALHTVLIIANVWGIWMGLPILIGLRPPPESIPPSDPLLTQLLVVVFNIPVVAALQECFCRGLLLQLLLKAEMSPHQANVFQSFVFALGHWPHLSLLRFVNLALYGLVMGWSRLRYKTLIPVFVVHSARNIFGWFLGL